MKSIFLSVVIICALTVAGLGGTLASWSDSETSYDNYIETGSIDLKVQGTDDAPWGEGLTAKFTLECVQPCDEYKVEIPVRNDGQCEDPSYLYIHFKRVQCSDVPPVHDGIRVDGFVKPEPEVVAEYGGIVDCKEVPGLGRIGDECSMKYHTSITITFDGEPVWGPAKLINLPCREILVGMLEPCGVEHIVDLVVHVQQMSEDDAIAEGRLADYVFGPDSKWYYWPSNALMKDKVKFDIEFDLFKHPIED